MSEYLYTKGGEHLGSTKRPVRQEPFARPTNMDAAFGQFPPEPLVQLGSLTAFALTSLAFREACATRLQRSHVVSVLEHLEAVATGELRELVITVPREPQGNNEWLRRLVAATFIPWHLGHYCNKTLLFGTASNRAANYWGCIARAMVFAQEKRSPDLIRWTITEDGLGWVADTPYLGKARGFLSAEVAGTAGMVIGFNGRYLLEGLSAIKGDTVEWCFQGSDAKSTILRPVDAGDFVSHDLVLMPVKLRDVAEELDNDWRAA